MIAFCGIKAHGPRCRRERICVEGRRPAAGRPLGFLLAFLNAGASVYDGLAETHMGTALYTHAERTLARRAFRSSSEAAGANPHLRLFLASERPRRHSEPEEPREQP